MQPLPFSYNQAMSERDLRRFEEWYIAAGGTMMVADVRQVLKQLGATADSLPENLPDPRGQFALAEMRSILHAGSVQIKPRMNL